MLRRMRIPPPFGLLAMGLVACAPAGPGRDPSRSFDAPASTSIPRPTPRDVPSTPPSGSAAASTAVTPVAPVAPAKLVEEQIPFVLAAHGRAPISGRILRADVRLHELDGALFLHAGGRVARLGAQGFSRVPAIEKAITRGLEVWNIFGVWPKSVFVELHPTQSALEEEIQGALFRVTERGLSRVHSLTVYDDYFGVWYGAQGRIGGVRYIGVDLSIAMRVDILDGPKGAVPEFSRRDDGQPRMGAFYMASFPSGHLFLFGADRGQEAQTSLAAVERWEPGATRGTFEHPPMPPGASGHLENTSLAAGSPAHVWIVAMANLVGKSTPEIRYLARWDGARWSLLDLPAPSFSPYGTQGTAASADGHLWIGYGREEGRGEIMHRAPDGTFSRADLPSPPPPLPSGPYDLVDLIERDGELWLLMVNEDDHERFAVYRTRPPAGAVALEINAVTP